MKVKYHSAEATMQSADEALQTMADNTDNIFTTQREIGSHY